MNDFLLRVCYCVYLWGYNVLMVCHIPLSQRFCFIINNVMITVK